MRICTAQMIDTVQDLIDRMSPVRAKRLQVAMEDAGLTSGSSAGDMLRAIVEEPIVIANKSGVSVPMLISAIVKLLSVKDVADALQSHEGWPSMQEIEGALERMKGKAPGAARAAAAPRSVVVIKQDADDNAEEECQNPVSLQEDGAADQNDDDNHTSNSFVESEDDAPLSSEPAHVDSLQRLLDGEKRLAEIIRNNRHQTREADDRVDILRDMLVRLLRGKVDAAGLCSEVIEMHFATDHAK